MPNDLNLEFQYGKDISQASLADQGKAKLIFDITNAGLETPDWEKGSFFIDIDGTRYLISHGNTQLFTDAAGNTILYI